MLSNATGSRNKSNDGGLIVTAEMRRILAKDGFISEADGSQRLRHLYQTREYPIERFPAALLMSVRGPQDGSYAFQRIRS